MSRPDVVAAFDFDGTLSPRDNFVPFLRRFAGTSATHRRVRERRVATREARSRELVAQRT